MEVSRIDAHMARWSSDGDIAVASYSAGLQFLSLDAYEVFDGSLKLTRSRYPYATENAKIIDMQWGPTLTGHKKVCSLAIVLDTGDLTILENWSREVTKVASLTSYKFSAVCWHGRRLIAGDQTGKVLSIDDFRRFDNEKNKIHETHSFDKPILHLVSSTTASGLPEIGAVLADNSGWIKCGSKPWKLVTKANRFRVVSACFCDHKLVTLRCGQVYVDDQALPTSSLLPGFLLSSPLLQECLAIHTNGARTEITGNSSSITLPQIQGDVIHAEFHPHLPMCMVILNKGSAARLEETSDQWYFPIPSSQSIAVYFCPIPGAVSAPAIRKCNSVAYGLSCTVNPSQRAYAASLVRPSSELKTDLLKIDATKTLKHQLSQLFTSEFADMIRLQWFLSGENACRGNPEVCREFQTAIAEILNRFHAKSPLDKLVLSLYNVTTDTEDTSEFTIRDLLISNTFRMKDAAKNMFSLMSVEGRVWNRCALTLLPIVDLDCHRSAEGDFSAYERVPYSLLSKSSDKNPLTEALLSAGSFCIYSGTKWENALESYYERTRGERSD